MKIFEIGLYGEVDRKKGIPMRYSLIGGGGRRGGKKFLVRLSSTSFILVYVYTCVWSPARRYICIYYTHKRGTVIVYGR